MALTDTEIKKLKPIGKDYQKADSRGIVLVISEAGGKFWRYEFRLEGKKFKYGFGNYPQISLSDARKIHEVARQLVAFNNHPASLLDSPACTPISNKASLTSSILNGLMIAVINFMFF